MVPKGAKRLIFSCVYADLSTLLASFLWIDKMMDAFCRNRDETSETSFCTTLCTAFATVGAIGETQLTSQPDHSVEAGLCNT